MARRVKAFVAPVGDVSATALTPLDAEAMAGAVFDQLKQAFGGDWRAVAERAMARAASEFAEEQARIAVVSPGRKQLDRLKAYDRAKPTIDRAAKGEFEVMPGERFDTSLKGQKVLVDLRSISGGAAPLHARRQIGDRELRAAAMLCQYAELAGASQLSGVPMGERVDGGMVDLSGSRLLAASMNARKYRLALAALSPRGRILVENVVVRGMAMEQAVRLPVMRRGDAEGGETTLRNRCNKAMEVLKDALEHLADVLGVPEKRG